MRKMYPSGLVIPLQIFIKDYMKVYDLFFEFEAADQMTEIILALVQLTF